MSDDVMIMNPSAFANYILIHLKCGHDQDLPLLERMFSVAYESGRKARDAQTSTEDPWSDAHGSDRPPSKKVQKDKPGATSEETTKMETLGGITVTSYYASGGRPALEIQESYAYHEHNHVRMMITEAQQLAQWILSQWPVPTVPMKLKDAAKVYANGCAVQFDWQIGSLSWSRIRKAYLAGAAFNKEDEK